MQLKKITRTYRTMVLAVADPFSPSLHIWKHFWLSQMEVKMLLASSGRNSGILINLLLYTEQPHRKELSSPYLQ